MGDTTFGSELRRRRLARGLSLRQLSELAHVDFTHLSRAENGRRRPTELLAAAVDIALEADGELIAIAHVQRAATAATAVTSDPVRRREFVATGVAAAVASLSGMRDCTIRVGRVGGSDVEPLDRAVARLRALGHQHGGANLWQAASGVAREGYHLLEQGTYTDEVEAALLAAIGRAQMCAGWLAFDGGNHDAARSCYNEALSLARQTTDPSIEVHALVNLAFQSTFLGMPRQAVRYAEAAERIAFGKMAIVPQIRRATAYASSGERAESRSAMSRARTMLDHAGDDEHGYWCSFISPEELDGIEGTAAMRLGDMRRAETLLTGSSGTRRRLRAEQGPVSRTACEGSSPSRGGRRGGSERERRVG
ncbi:helix-turn-helix domain-containing protein [Catellatospora sp. IY07-71]|uniref:helix-turn-helix domain-containing protein n=1 Tax=Catellatospora sp. IY07-71 TaxID=2728827 RepID=UPI001BB36674|nr:helix-turn-helix domain-containing protein [Catellatospora sp. IY07-71]